MARSRHAEFHEWAPGARDALRGKSMPRDFDLRTLPPEVAEEADARLTRFGRELPDLAAAQKEKLESRLARADASGTANPQYHRNLREELSSISGTVSDLRDIGPIDTSFDGLTKNLQRLLDQGVRKAKSATRYNEQSGSGELEIPAGSAFYPEHAGGYSQIAANDAPGDDDYARNLILSGTGLSAGAMPRVELKGAAGLSRIHANSRDVGVSLTHSAAESLNRAALTVKSGVDKDSITQVSAGNHSVHDLPPEHAAVLLQNYKGLVEEKPSKFSTELKDVQYSESWRTMAPAVQALVGAAGKSGTGVVARGLRTMRDPHHWSERPSTSGAWKVPSYSTITALHHGESADLRSAVHHMVGASIHGDRWWAAHPGADQHVARMLNHPAMQASLNVNDIHHARAMLGLPYGTSIGLGDLPRPETMLSRPGHWEDEISSTRRGTGLQTPDLGYLGQEHATQGVKMSFTLNGKRHEVPLSAKQALIWNMQQAQNPAVQPKIASGEKSLLQSHVDRDVRKALNPSGVIPIL